MQKYRLNKIFKFRSLFFKVIALCDNLVTVRIVYSVFVDGIEDSFEMGSEKDKNMRPLTSKEYTQLRNNYCNYKKRKHDISKLYVKEVA